MIGESKVPLDKNIIPDRPREFFPTFLEWISDGNAEQILDNAQQSGTGETTIFTTPENFTFFLTSVHLSSDAAGGGGVSSALATIFFGSSNSIKRLLSHRHVLASPDHVTSSLAFTMPMKLNAGESIIINNGHSTFQSVANITGFLLPKKISIR